MSLFSAVLLGTKLLAAIDLLAEVVGAPSFPEDEIDGVRTLILQELRQREDRPAQIVMDLARQRFFDESPLMNDYLGTEETIGRLRRSDLVDYWRHRYTANNLTISIAGNFRWEAVLLHLRAVTQSWSGGSGRMHMESLRGHAQKAALERETAQEHICLALPALSATDPDYYAMSLMTQIFAGVSASRLRVEVREKRGLAYAAYGRFDGLEKTGLLRVYVGTSSERAHESVEVVLVELHKLERDGVTDDELRLAKTRVKSQLVMRSESTAARMATNLRSWWFEEKLHSLEDIRRRIDSVTVQQISNLLESLQMSRTVTAVGIGPRSEAELFGDLLGASV
jgi:predicted Zn-dependent peptidase